MPLHKAYEALVFKNFFYHFRPFLPTYTSINFLTKQAQKANLKGLFQPQKLTYQLFYLFYAKLPKIFILYVKAKKPHKLFWAFAAAKT